MSTIDVRLGTKSYPIFIESGLIGTFGSRLSSFVKSKKAFLVTDTDVEKLYLETVKHTLMENGFEVHSFSVKAGEESKTLGTAEEILSFFFKHKGDRASFFIALGGGVIGDLTGFCASLALRGVDFVQVPTTLLSQVDSSVGGKTGVNSSFGKNLIGAFCQPKAVFIDPSVLKTLPKDQLLSGFAEVVKYGLIRDKTFFNFLIHKAREILTLDDSLLAEAIEKSIGIKADIVEKDEFETNDLRVILNLGHTFGHALEAKSGMDGSLPHGIAVAVGIVCAAKLSADMGLCPYGVLDEITAFFKAVGLPASYPKSYEPLELVDLMMSDKKTKNGMLNLVLMTEIGHACLVKNVERQLVLNAFDFAREK